MSGQFDLRDSIPYATDGKRYLVNWTKRHIDGGVFVAPIKVEDYYIETHKNKTDALNDVYKYMKSIGVDVKYVK